MNLTNRLIGRRAPAALYELDLYTVWQTPFDRSSYKRLLEMTREIREVLND